MVKRLLFIFAFSSLVTTYAAQESLETIKKQISDAIDNVEVWHFYSPGDEYKDLITLKNLIEKYPQIFIHDPAFASAHLFIAIDKNINDVAEWLVNTGMNLDAQNATGKTALMIATSKGNIGLFQLLLAHGANPYIQNEKDQNKTAGEYAKGKAKKAFEKELKIQKTEKSAYTASKLPVQTELNNYTINDISKIIADYAYPDDYNDYVAFTQNVKDYLQSTKKKPADRCNIQ